MNPGDSAMEIQSLEGSAELRIWLQNKACVKRRSFSFYPLSKHVSSTALGVQTVYLELWETSLLTENTCWFPLSHLMPLSCSKKRQRFYLALFFKYWWKREAWCGFEECLPAQDSVHRLLVHVQTSLHATRMDLSAWLTWSVSREETALPLNFFE